jgi:hypothetical protein
VFYFIAITFVDFALLLNYLIKFGAKMQSFLRLKFDFTQSAESVAGKKNILGKTKIKFVLVYYYFNHIS